MSVHMIIVIVFCIILHQIHGSDVVKEVKDGVEFINTGSVELVVPEILSFTVKRLKKSQLCVGDFVICYEATSIIMREDQAAYYNLGTTCPEGTCTLMIHPRTAFYLFLKSSDDTVDAEFHDEFNRVCPRKVINNRQNFTILELPDCPVIMNDATLPKTTTKNNTTLTTIGIIVGCVVVIIILLIVVIVGYCIYKRSNR